jgi:uncharacterized protein YbjT (DUF2867 family)
MPPGSTTSTDVDRPVGELLFVVFSASGRPGLAQVAALREAGGRVRAITRQTRLHPTLQGTEVVAADLNDPDSVARACDGADVVLYTAPTFAERRRSVEHIALVGRCAAQAGARRVVYNTTSWFPAEPIGVPTMDRGVALKDALAATGAPVTIVQPSLFMDNLLTRWVKPHLLRDDEFAYPHAEELQVSWICLDDVARFMIATAQRDDCVRATIDIGGPEALRPAQVAEILGRQLGRTVTYRRLTPREFGERMYEVFSSSTDVDRDTYVSDLVKHYEFKNSANPFLVPMQEVIARFDIRPSSLGEWCARQNWSTEDEPIGSVSG